jgi:hypothetical protein
MTRSDMAAIAQRSWWQADETLAAPSRWRRSSDDKQWSSHKAYPRQ